MNFLIQNARIAGAGTGKRKNLPLMSQLRFNVGKFFRLLCSVTPFTLNDPYAIDIGLIQNKFFFDREVLTEKELAHHTHIVGASGFGKTVFLSKIVRSLINQKKGMLFLDLKGDVELIEKFKRFAKEAGRENDVQMFNLSDLENSQSYNLLGNGTATQIRDRIMTSFTWSEEYYKHQAASFLLKILIALCFLRERDQTPFTIGDLYKLTTSRDSIRALLLKIPKTNEFERTALSDVITYIATESNWNALQGLRSQLESLVLSDFGKLITSCETGIDLFKAVQEGKLVFMFLDTRSYGPTAAVIGRFILQDLKAVSSKIDSQIRHHERKPFCVIIDEFADLAQEDFIAFLDRARSSKMSIIVSHQEISDLKKVSPEFAMRLMGNTSTLFAFLQKGPESADLIANVAGTKSVKKRTYQNESWLGVKMRTGDFSERDTEEFVIHPNAIKSLKVGECAVVKKYPRSRAHLVRVDAD